MQWRERCIVLNRERVKVKGKKIFIIIIISLIVVMVSKSCIIRLVNGNSYGLKKSGNLYDNISDFSVQFEENPNELVQVYLRNITYEIKNINKEEMRVTIEVQIPQISDELSNILDTVISENKDMGYDEQKTRAKKVFIDMLKSEKLNKKTETLICSVKKIDGSYKIIPSQEWNVILTENLEEQYMEYFKILIGGMSDEIPQ